uniref:Uncharacterized protein n=1 Tax=Romanomermis culicivorax TaxID=13658 RepID=A0A915JAN0_ROMCU
LPKDWTVLFSLVHGEHIIIVSFDGANDWAGIYALLNTQICTNCQEKNKDPVVKAIHFDAYQPDVLAYAALNAFYPILLFLAFNWPKPAPAFHNIPLMAVVPAHLTAKVPQNKKKKQKDKWNKSPDVSNDEDPVLEPKKVYDNPKCLQAAVASAMKSGLMQHTGWTTTADLIVSVTSINKFLKLMLDNILLLAPVPTQELTPVQPVEMDTKADAMATSDHTLTDIAEETPAYKVTAMDIAPSMPTIDPSFYVATLVVLPSPLMIDTVAATRPNKKNNKQLVKPVQPLARLGSRKPPGLKVPVPKQKPLNH